MNNKNDFFLEEKMWVHEIRIEDIEPLIELFYQNDMIIDLLKDIEYLKKVIDKELEYDNLIIVTNISTKELIGSCGYYGNIGEPRNNRWLQRFVIKNKFQKRGLGQKLYGAIETKLRLKRCTAIYLWTTSEHLLKRAGEFYEKAGYKEIGRFKDFWYKDCDKVFLMKNL